MLQRPSAAGLLLCEQVILEEKTRNITLVNSFTRFRGSNFPTPPQRFVVYAVLTDGLGDAWMSLVVHRLDTVEEVHDLHWQMKFRDPLRQIRVVLRLTDLSFPVPVALPIQPAGR